MLYAYSVGVVSLSLIVRVDKTLLFNVFPVVTLALTVNVSSVSIDASSVIDMLVLIEV